MSGTHCSSEAERLKAEGNRHFLKNDFTAAYKKYSEALQYDGKNAILYCNRAACSLGLSRYMDAATDATKATDLSPAYAKAWGRLAAARTGLGHHRGAVIAWQRAVAVLPKEDLTPGERRQRAQYSAELTTAQKRLDDSEDLKQPEGIVRRKINEDVPWKRALAMLPSLTTWESSAWTIAVAYWQWDEAVSYMKLGKTTYAPQGMGYFGRTGVIEGLTNALIADERVFHIADQDFFDLYNKQMMFEMARYRGWATCGSRELVEDAPKRLLDEGWNSLRPALSITVRAWIMRAFMEERLTGNCEAALDFLTSALEVLRWGQVLWKDVRDEDKGAIFQQTFVRGVKCLRLNTFMAAYTKNPGPFSKYSLEELLVGAQDLLDELTGAPTEPQRIEDSGFFLSFFRYPTGEAYAIKGFYYNYKAKELRSAQGLSREVINLYLNAVKAYTDASTFYPQDEESKPWYMHCAMHAMLEGVGQVKAILVFLDGIKTSIPLVKRIWECGANWASGFDAHFAKDMVLRDKFLQMIQNGQIGRDTVVSLSRGGEIVIVQPGSNLFL